MIALSVCMAIPNECRHDIVDTGVVPIVFFGDLPDRHSMVNMIIYDLDPCFMSHEVEGLARLLRLNCL